MTASFDPSQLRRGIEGEPSLFLGVGDICSVPGSPWYLVVAAGHPGDVVLHPQTQRHPSQEWSRQIIDSAREHLDLPPFDFSLGGIFLSVVGTLAMLPFVAAKSAARRIGLRA